MTLGLPGSSHESDATDVRPTTSSKKEPRDLQLKKALDANHLPTITHTHTLSRPLVGVLEAPRMSSRQLYTTQSNRRRPYHTGPAAA